MTVGRRYLKYKSIDYYEGGNTSLHNIPLIEIVRGTGSVASFDVVVASLWGIKRSKTNRNVMPC